MFVLFCCLTLGVILTKTAFAETVNFSMLVQYEEQSTSSPAAKKDDWDPAVANILNGLGLGKKVYIRVRTVRENEPATNLILATTNQRYTFTYSAGYGTVGKYYKLNASKYGLFNSTIIGRFAP
ncbi:hypothetical protein JDW15_07055 [Aerococcaceae bacterium zg-ZJ1578]|nr:hypothetical protein [Aerococcaceae bacterium zg-1578]